MIVREPRYAYDDDALRATRSSGMREIKTAAFVLTALVSTIVVGVAWATEAEFNTEVDRLMVDSANFGGCAARITGSVAANGLACSGPWVSFSCTGDFNSKSDGSNKFAQAQLAFVTDKQVRIRLDDTKRHNGYCFARNILVTEVTNP